MVQIIEFQQVPDLMTLAPQITIFINKLPQTTRWYEYSWIFLINTYTSLNKYWKSTYMQVNNIHVKYAQILHIDEVKKNLKNLALKSPWR